MRYLLIILNIPVSLGNLALICEYLANEFFFFGHWKNEIMISFFFSFSYEIIVEIAEHLLQRTKHRPKIGIICGSGLGKRRFFLEKIETKKKN